MSKYGMLGLLEGIGESGAEVGKMMQRASLAEAEDQRRMKLEMIRRQWAKEDKVDDRTWAEGQSDKNFDRTQAANLGAELRQRGYAGEDFERNQTAMETKAEADQRRAQENAKYANDLSVGSRQKSESDKLIDRADAALASGEIDRDTYNNITLGLTKTGNDLTADKKANLKIKAFEQAAMEIRGKEPMTPATPAETKAINARAGEIYRQAVGGEAPKEEVVLPLQMVDDIAKRFAGGKPEEVTAAVSDLKKRGVPDQQIVEIQAKADKIRSEQERAAKEKSQAESTSNPILSPAAQRLFSNTPAPQESAPPSLPMSRTAQRNRQSMLRPPPKGLLEQ